MKIRDLLERQIDTQISPDRDFKRPFVPRKTHDEKSHYGTFARVRDDKKDPHMVIKNDTSPQNRPDNYNKFINELIKKDLINQNIHFPRVYNIQKIKGKWNQFIFKYQMEKLYPMTSLSIDEMLTLIEQVTGDDASGKVEPEEYNGDKYQKRAVSRLSYIIDDALSDQRSFGRGVVMESLVEAIDLIKQIGEDIEVYPNDIGGNNILIRRTSVGCQIVITDPFYG